MSGLLNGQTSTRILWAVESTVHCGKHSLSFTAAAARGSRCASVSLSSLFGPVSVQLHHGGDEHLVWNTVVHQPLLHNETLHLSTSPSLPLLLQSVHPASYEERPSALFISDLPPTSCCLSLVNTVPCLLITLWPVKRKERKKDRARETHYCAWFVCDDTSSDSAASVIRQ